MKKKLLVILAIPLIFLSITIVYLVAEHYYWMWQPPPHKVMPLIDIDLDYLTPRDNLTQGMTFLVNVTVYSEADHIPEANKELSIPLSLALHSTYLNGAGQELYPEETGFTYSFEPNLVILEPYGSNSSLLTVELNEDAPVGTYNLRVKLGNSEEHHLDSIGFSIDVNPK
jgi:hypothetical protein